MNTSVIIDILPGHVAPRGYLQEALKHCPSCVGIAIQDKDDDKNSVLDTSAELKSANLDDLVKIVEGCKAQRTVIHLANLAENFDAEDDLQPFVFQMAVKDGDPENILAVFMEGDFPNYSIPAGGHTDEYNLWEKFVFPMMLEKFDLANSDPEDFYNRLRASTTEQAIMNTVGHRAAVVFVPIEGELISFGRNELGGQFDWGTTSNRFKWGDATLLDKAAETAITAVKTTVKKSRLLSLMGTSAPSTAPLAEDKEKKITTDPKTGVHTVGNTTYVDNDIWKRWPGCSAKTHTMTVVPKKLTGNARNRWIRLFTNNPNGDLPKEKDRDGFMIPVHNSLTGFSQQDLSTNDEVKTLASSVKHFQTSGSMKPISNDQVKEASDLAHTAAPPDDKRPASDFLPELSAEAKKGTVDLVTDWATRTKGPTKLDIQRIESKWPKFSTTMGIRMEDLLGWSIADKKALAKKYPDAMALAFTELQLHILENGVGIDMNTEHVNDQTKKDQKGHDGTEKKQVELPPTQPGTPATGKKKSRLAQLSGQAA